MIKFVILIIIITTIHIKADCFDDEIMQDICVKCNNFIDNCKSCELLSNNIICKECYDGFLPEIRNQVIIRCNNICEFETINDILLENDECKMTTWGASQTDYLNYDIINVIPRVTSFDEKNSLIDFFTYLNGNFWKINYNWLEGDPCLDAWYGVQCNSRGNIISLYFKNNSLDGIIMDSISNLKYLRRMYIFNDGIDKGDKNKLYMISENINKCSYLKELVISNVNLNQSLTSSFFKFQRLEILDLSDNNLEGTIYFFTSNNYKILNLSNNSFGGLLIDLINLEKLEIAKLNNNIFEGNVPILVKSINLKILDLRNNRLNGQFPIEYFEKNNFVNFIYLGLMMNEVVLPDFCKNFPLCYKKLTIDMRSVNDQDFKLTEEDIKYLS